MLPLRNLDVELIVGQQRPDVHTSLHIFQPLRGRLSINLNQLHKFRVGAMKLTQGTQAIHADDHLNANSDVAPPLHVSTTFRYADDSKDLVPIAHADVRLLRALKSLCMNCNLTYRL